MSGISKNLKNFKSKSSIVFTQVTPTPVNPKLCDMKVGDTFIRNGAVCMAILVCHDISGIDGVVLEDPRTVTVRKTFPVSIVNLQTGSVWTPDDQEEEVVPIKMTAQITSPE